MNLKMLKPSNWGILLCKNYITLGDYSILVWKSGGSYFVCNSTCYVIITCHVI